MTHDLLYFVLLLIPIAGPTWYLHIEAKQEAAGLGKEERLP